MWYRLLPPYRLLIYCFLVFAIAGCSNSDDSPAEQQSYERGDYVTTGSQSQVSATEINYILSLSGTSLGVSASYNIRFFKLTYKTIDPQGNLTNASGLVAVPQKTNGASSPMLSLQHGTIYLDSQAPSNAQLTAGNSLPSLNNIAVQTVLAASLGYLVIAPDYLGYGESTLAVHPYMHADSLADSIIDMIRAAQQYFAGNNIAHNGQVFLGGYSEGGYATLAAHKKIQESFSGEISVSASAPGAGAYHVSQTARELLASTQLSAPDTVAFVMKAYDMIYGLNRLQDIFQSPYAALIDTGFDGNSEAPALSPDPTELFQSAFLTDFLADGETELKDLFAQNDIHAWQPDSLVYFYHGVDDTVVPYSNMTSAMNAMAQNPYAIFTDCNVTPADHGTCVLPYLQFVLSTFTGLATDL